MDHTSHLTAPVPVTVTATVTARSPRQAAVQMESAVLTTVAEVLDRLADPGADDPGPKAGVVAGGLRAALRTAGPPCADEQPLSPAAAGDRPGRDRLAARIGDLFAAGSPVGEQVRVDTDLVADAVAQLRCLGVRFAGEPVAVALRRLWEHLYLRVPLTVLVLRADPGRPFAGKGSVGP
ncbi:hypothetical protein ACF9IK_35700 [Kitasatospora hibisci]|uniref:hypothetical protein n=1 Tax=Kitasatospora hibisci TaxID=3369522 RepID=UPI00375532DB